MKFKPPNIKMKGIDKLEAFTANFKFELDAATNDILKKHAEELFKEIKNQKLSGRTVFINYDTLNNEKYLFKNCVLVKLKAQCNDCLFSAISSNKSNKRFKSMILKHMDKYPKHKVMINQIWNCEDRTRLSS